MTLDGLSASLGLCSFICKLEIIALSWGIAEGTRIQHLRPTSLALLKKSSNAAAEQRKGARPSPARPPLPGKFYRAPKGTGTGHVGSRVSTELGVPNRGAQPLPKSSYRDLEAILATLKSRKLDPGVGAVMRPGCGLEWRRGRPEEGRPASLCHCSRPRR